MRIRQLDLFKYGKFTDATLRFPAAAHDFHVIVGPNEAGKSTVRTAVSELLFGMKLKTPLNFVHDISDLRLGGVLDVGRGGADGAALAFHRARGNKSLRTPDDNDTKLPDDFLDAALDGATREFFEQMFGLDHERLVAGGRSLLDASDKLGQVLFESAAGVGSLGPVREELETLRAALWAPRSGKTTFAVAEAAFTDATTELRAFQVRTRDWVERQEALDKVRGEIEQARAAQRRLDAVRSKLERVRRLAPYLNAEAAKAAELAALGPVIDLPPSATADLLDARATLSVVRAKLDLHREELAKRQAERDALVADADAIAFAADIDALDALRVECARHEQARPLVEADIARELEAAFAAAAQLGWPRDEAALRAALPSELALKTVTHLLHRRGALEQALDGARDALAERERELAQLSAQRAAIVADEVPHALRAALADAQGFRQGEAKERALAQALAESDHMLADALDQLGRWRAPVATLKTMDLPSAARLAAYQKADSDGLSAVSTARGALAEARGAFEKLALQEQHAVQGRQIVTQAEVRAERVRRDGLWSELKRGAVALDAGAPALDDAILRADQLVDAQLGTVQAAAELQALRQQLEVERARLARRETEFAEAEQALAVTRRDWSEAAGAAGLPGMALADLGDWLGRRETALAAQRTVDQQTRELDSLRAERAGAQQALAAALLAAAPGADADLDADRLSQWLGAAEAFVQAAERAVAQRGNLDARVTEAEQARATAAARVERAQRDHDKWDEQWRAALAEARLAERANSEAAAQGAVDLANEVAARLAAADAPARRLDAMQADLAALARQAAVLADALDPGLPATHDGAAIARALAARLLAARESAAAIARADEALAQARRQLDEANAGLATEQARVAPLLASAQVDSIDAALPLAARSDTARRLREEIAAARATLIRDGDGLAPDAIAAEIAEQDLAEVPARLEATRQDSETLGATLSRLAQEEVVAQQALDAIAGQSSAALAEAKRQEALAAMGDTAEQYLEAATASRLLRWAIERYREQRQGPMLGRASEIFAALTLGDFSRLVVDTERQPPELSARRANGKPVAVGGLSEGTRDQLFLALRIAALELQLENKAALPFVADDLFINFDDTRSKAGLAALRELSTRTQVLFLTHHAHLLPLVTDVFGPQVNVVELQREAMA
ncbi:YhaN family protein [Burkholderia perseverans]|uniref:YhaN family protein n=1 Tax=Burkholderia perseverans TaxID=2615214 RepID=UPI001FF03731|nr:YhaN family protein [Burkholderia perseverans]